MTVLTASSSIDEAVATATAELARWQVPGLELAVVHGNDVLFAGGLGIRGVEEPEPVAASTLFHHGSCGKAYTGLLAALLAEDGLLDLDAPVRRYIPELRLVDEVVAARVTTRDLLGHRSGLGRHDLAWIMNPGWTVTDVLDRLQHVSMVGDLRAQWSYSNFGYALAGAVIGRVTGSSWGDQLRERVFGPLGMTRTVTGSAAMQADADHARPHLLRNGSPEPTVYRVLDGVAPAGELISCADDSVRWLRAQLGDGAVSATAVALTHQPVMLVPPGSSPFPQMVFTGYGLGWLSGSYRGRRLVWHNGGIDGFSTQTLLLPDEKIGVVASTNLHSTTYPMAVMLAVADALLGEANDPSWYDVLRVVGPESEPADNAVPAPRCGGAPLRDLADYAGTYTDPLYGALEIASEPGGLTGSLGHYAVDLRHRHVETWDLRYDALGVDATMTFQAGPDGSVADVDVVMEPGGEPVRFHRAATEANA